MIAKGRAEGHRKATLEQRLAIDEAFHGAPLGWRLQVMRDLLVYPMYDSLASWLDGNDYMVKGGFYDSRTGDIVEKLARQYLAGRL